MTERSVAEFKRLVLILDREPKEMDPVVNETILKCS